MWSPAHKMLDLQQSVSGELMSAVLCEIDTMTSTNLIHYTCRTCTNLDYLRSHEKEWKIKTKKRNKKISAPVPEGAYFFCSARMNLVRVMQLVSIVSLDAMLIVHCSDARAWLN